MNLRNLARGKPCQIRLPHTCNADPETTVACHVRLSGISGIGLKVPDWLAAWGCSACHAAVDNPEGAGLERDYVRLAHLEGVMRTQAEILKLHPELLP